LNPASAAGIPGLSVRSYRAPDAWAEQAGVSQSEIARIESGKREPSIPTLQRILAGSGLELRFRLAPIDDHDRVLTERQARRSKSEQNVAEARHRSNVAQFAANARKR
jgi:transcriptional regulator with XRE-family HTH domain